MTVVKVDTTDESKFDQKSFTTLPKGSYVFELANDLKVELATTGKNIVKVEARCMDDGEYKGIPVWDNIALTPKADWKLVHLALACGTQTEYDIKEAGGVDLELLIAGSTFEAAVSVVPPTKAADGSMYKEKNNIAAYLFEPSKN